MNIDKYKDFGPAVLRVGIALVYIYFGVSQLMNPDMFTFWLPEWTSMLPISSTAFIYMNGVFEVVFGSLLALGLFTRISSLLLGLHLAAITLSIGFTQIGVRDFGLTLATFAIFIQGKDKYSLDNKLFKK
jgi:uncharacterized membrane protein YphA (DoxX/SURF4 family)